MVIYDSIIIQKNFVLRFIMDERDSASDLQIKFGQHLKSLREKKNISSAEMARRCLMDRSNYSRIEMGNTNPTLQTLVILSKALGVSMEELFEGF